MTTLLRRIEFPFVLVALMAILSSTACSSGPGGSPTGPGAMGPNATERRVGFGGGGDTQCDDDPAACYKRGRFTVTAADGSTLFAAIQPADYDWRITGGSGRFNGTRGSAAFGDVAGGVIATLQVDVPHPSLTLLIKGTLSSVSSAERPWSECETGLSTFEVFVGSLEHLGRATLERDLCTSPF